MVESDTSRTSQQLSIAEPKLLIASLPLAVLLALAPIPFASVTEGWAAALAIGVFLAAAMVAFILPEPRRLRGLVAPLLASGCMALLGVAQALTWPLDLLRQLSPEHFQLFSTAQTLTKESAGSVRPSLSLAPNATLAAALFWAALGAALLAAGGAAAIDRRARRVLGSVIVGTALFEVLYGARRWFARSSTIWGIDVPGDPRRLRGTFVNPDHLALYLEIALALVFAWGWWSWRRAHRAERAEGAAMLVAPPVLMWLVLFVGLAFTGSRAGLAAAIAGVSTQGLLLVPQLSTRRRMGWSAIGIAVAGLGLGTVAWVGLDEGLGRWIGTSQYELSNDHRPLAHRATIELWKRFPLLGTGLGTFEEAFPLVEPPELSAERWTHAHSDFLELLATSGVLGVVVVIAGLVAVVRRARRIQVDGHRSEDRAAALATLGALVAVGVHESVDFGLTMPANAFTIAVVVGACLTAKTARTRRRDG